MRNALKKLQRYLVTPQISKYRVYVFLPSSVLTENANIAICRQDDATFGVLQSRLHEIWSLKLGTALEDRPRYTNSSTFETFPFPEGLTPLDTAHQQTEAVQGGALIPANLLESFGPIVESEKASQATENKAIWPKFSAKIASKTPGLAASLQASGQGMASTGSARTGVNEPGLKQLATQIATAAKRLNDLREAWLNPPEWTRRVPEVVPLGMDTSPYPDRIEPKPGLSEADLKALQKRTLTNLYNQRPAWLHAAHEALDATVAAAYGWPDYTPAMTDDEILQRLLALNLARAKIEAGAKPPSSA